MRKRIELFKENTTIGGYSIAVRDDWSFKIKRVHISDTERDAYVEKFGDKIILEGKFMNWWIEFNEINPSDRFLLSIGKLGSDLGS